MVQFHEAIAGPNQRAGLRAAPVSGPIIKILIVTIKPIGRPATALKVPRLFTANAQITVTSKKVPTASAMRAFVIENPEATNGIPRWPALPATPLRTRAPRVAPANCAVTKDTSSLILIRLHETWVSPVNPLRGTPLALFCYSQLTCLRLFLPMFCPGISESQLHSLPDKSRVNCLNKRKTGQRVLQSPHC